MSKIVDGVLREEIFKKNFSSILSYRKKFYYYRLLCFCNYFNLFLEFYLIKTATIFNS